jgi:hypothetical protein
VSRHLRTRSVALMMGITLACMLVLPVAGCRVGIGEDCVADSDCKLGLICLKRSQVIDAQIFEERFGTCYSDDDTDGVPADGDNSGSITDNRCGVHVEINAETRTETVYEEILSKCDDNCEGVANARISRRFVCLGKDACCPADEGRKEKADKFDLCEDLTDQPDTCTACFTGDTRTPDECYLQFGDGYDLDQDGCVHCRELGERLACSRSLHDDLDDWIDSCDDAVANDQLPRPACSGEWQCTAPNNGYCKYVPTLRNVEDGGGYNVLFQLDSDWDGLGDECDNCSEVPNGINCDANPLRCDANKDGQTTPAEDALGNQTNSDGDSFGDACDTCPDVADNDNADLDGDGRGNPCDNDDDGDGVCDPEVSAADCSGSDNCPEAWNPNQGDFDGDEDGDACDVDVDGDGIREDGDGSGIAGDKPCVSGARRDCDDNCQLVSNGDQADEDGDGIGDACE